VDKWIGSVIKAPGFTYDNLQLPFQFSGRICYRNGILQGVWLMGLSKWKD